MLRRRAFGTLEKDDESANIYCFVQLRMIPGGRRVVLMTVKDECERKTTPTGRKYIGEATLSTNILS